MVPQGFNSEQTAMSLPAAFIAEGLLCNHIGESVIAALDVCSKILGKGAPNPTAVMRAREFLDFLKQVLDFSAEMDVPVTMSYHSICHQLAYFYASTCGVRISGRPVWDETCYSIQILHHYYVRNMQPAEYMQVGSFNSQGRQPAQPAALASDRAARTEAWASQLEVGNAEPVQSHDKRSRNAEATETKASNASVSRNANLVRPAVQPTRLARCKNWPEITQEFWPRAGDRYWHLLRKHGPATTWYASGERQAPPASALPTPSFYQNRRLQSTLSTIYESEGRTSSVGTSSTTSTSSSLSSTKDKKGRTNLRNSENNLSAAATLCESETASFSNDDMSSLASEDSILSEAEGNTSTNSSRV